MLGLITSLFIFVAVSLAQETTATPSASILTSLWIPFKTISGTPLASIAEDHPNANSTIYVISCPTAHPGCGIAPNLTLTEGPSSVEYSTTNSAGTAFLGCSIAGSTSAVCSDIASGQGEVVRGTTSTLAPSQIVYQGVKVTASSNATSTTSSGSTTDSSGQGTASSMAGAVVTDGPRTMGSALGAGLFALAVL